MIDSKGSSDARRGNRKYWDYVIIVMLVTALPPIELDGSSGEDEDQARDEETEIHRRDQDQAPRHHTTVSIILIDPTQCHRRRAGSASSRMYPDTCVFGYLQQRAHHYLFPFRSNLCLPL
ncbi:hypothetical protein G5I_08916 [Acromyrmex echinatior]|uniref:Uncharacterized protein n=1 Tax=Acromyrmex echinatior TaxID=103372 RepID=F4WST9_ACREC|nr:hypothetical protein G5I_08916 [Acromyrmex echinatior]